MGETTTNLQTLNYKVYLQAPHCGKGQFTWKSLGSVEPGTVARAGLVEGPLATRLA